MLTLLSSTPAAGQEYLQVPVSWVILLVTLIGGVTSCRISWSYGRRSGIRQVRDQLENLPQQSYSGICFYLSSNPLQGIVDGVEQLFDRRAKTEKEWRQLNEEFDKTCRELKQLNADSQELKTENASLRRELDFVYASREELRVQLQPVREVHEHLVRMTEDYQQILELCMSLEEKRQMIDDLLPADARQPAEEAENEEQSDNESVV